MAFPGPWPCVARLSNLEEEVEILSLFDISEFINIDDQLKKNLEHYPSVENYGLSVPWWQPLVSPARYLLLTWNSVASCLASH